MKKFSFKKHLIIFMSFIIILSTSFIYSFTCYTANVTLIAHAGGGDVSDKNIFLNCQEMFYIHYNKGIRLFEYDFSFSSDGKLIGNHNWEYVNKNITYEEYKNLKINGKYTGVTLDFIFEIITEYSDIKIVLDTKEEDEVAVIDEIVLQANLIDLDISSNIIPQIYTSQMWEQIKDYNFDQFIFTNYKANYNRKTLNSFLKDQDKITIVAFGIAKMSYIKDMKKLGKKVAIFTKNSIFSALFYSGLYKIDYIYTDYLYK